MNRATILQADGTVDYGLVPPALPRSPYAAPVEVVIREYDSHRGVTTVRYEGPYNPTIAWELRNGAKKEPEPE